MEYSKYLWDIMIHQLIKNASYTQNPPFSKCKNISKAYRYSTETRPTSNMQKENNENTTLKTTLNLCDVSMKKKVTTGINYK